MAEHRYEREIDELLRHIEGEQRAPLPFRRRRAARWVGAWRRARGTLRGQSAVEQLMALALLLVLTAFVVGWLAPALAAPLAAPLGVLAVGCLIAALGISVWNGAAGRPTRYRGRAPYPSAGAGAVDWNALVWQFRRWLRRLRG
jgi:hypothetical protein